MKNLHYVYLIFIFLIFNSCRNNYKPYLIDNKLGISSFHNRFMPYYKFQCDLSELFIYSYENQKLQRRDTIYFNFQAYISNDTVTIFFNDARDCYVNYYLINGNYKVDISYNTDIGGTYPDDKKYGGTGFVPKISFEKLVLNTKKKINIKDTIFGYLEFETKPFKRKDCNNFVEKVKGPFVVIVKNKKDMLWNTIP